MDSCCCALACFSDSRAHEVRQKELEKDLTGPLPNTARRCTDVLWLSVYILFWIGMIIIAGISFSEGNYRRLLFGIDSWGNVCDYDNSRLVNDSNSGLDLSGRKYLYYRDPSDKNAAKICVPECPNVLTATGEPTVKDCNAGPARTQCQELYHVCLTDIGPYTVHPASATSMATTAADSANDGCPPDVYDSSDKIGLRRCAPNSDLKKSGFGGLVGSFYDRVDDAGEELQKIFSDFAESAKIILLASVGALMMSFFLIILLYCLTGVIVYTLVFMSVVAMVGLTAFLGKQWTDLRNEYNDTPEPERISRDKQNVQIFLGLFIASLLFTLIMIFIIVAMRKRISQSIALFKEASRAARGIPSVYLTPFLTWGCLAFTFAWWFWVLLYLATVWDSSLGPDGHYEWSIRDGVGHMWWYYLFGLFWAANFILACEEFVVSFAVVTWYFAASRKTFKSPLFKAIYAVTRFHLGSMALGSLLVAIVQFIRAVLMYLKERMDDNTSKVAKFILKCVLCCLWCAEHCIKYINKVAYVETAIYGYSFCKAARQGFSLLLDNLPLVATVNGMAGLVLFIMKLLVVTTAGILSLSVLRQDENLHYYGLVVFVICFFAYAIADAFFDVYKLTIDALLVCFCEDKTRNNGQDKPYHMSKNLLKFMEKNAVTRKETLETDA
eukprot:m.21737 g.21737  ORF g.21737 m.21737 type:complete len:667 (-) comp6538_c0_seq2:124-2124(-)